MPSAEQFRKVTTDEVILFYEIVTGESSAMSKKINQVHAATRLAERYDESILDTVTFEKLVRAVAQKEFHFVARQTSSRSVCYTCIDGAEVWFVLNRLRGSIITVLTEEQAQAHIAEGAKKWVESLRKSASALAEKGA